MFVLVILIKEPGIILRHLAPMFLGMYLQDSTSTIQEDNDVCPVTGQSARQQELDHWLQNNGYPSGDFPS